MVHRQATVAQLCEIDRQASDDDFNVWRGSVMTGYPLYREEPRSFMSAKQCGCDVEAAWVCERHRAPNAEALVRVHTVDNSGAVEVREVRQTSTTGAEKGIKIARFDLVPWDAVWLVAEHFGKGAKKYADRNWERGYQWSWLYAALQRHLTAFWQGEDHGEEPAFGRYRHIVAVAWHALVLTTFSIRGIGVDDRPKGAGIKEGL